MVRSDGIINSIARGCASTSPYIPIRVYFRRYYYYYIWISSHSVSPNGKYVGCFRIDRYFNVENHISSYSDVVRGKRRNECDAITTGCFGVVFRNVVRFREISRIFFGKRVLARCPSTLRLNIYCTLPVVTSSGYFAAKLFVQQNGDFSRRYKTRRNVVTWCYGVGHIFFFFFSWQYRRLFLPKSENCFVRHLRNCNHTVSNS